MPRRKRTRSGSRNSHPKKAVRSPRTSRLASSDSSFGPSGSRWICKEPRQRRSQRFSLGNSISAHWQSKGAAPHRRSRSNHCRPPPCADTALRGAGWNKLERHTGGPPDASYACFRPGFRLGAGRAARCSSCYPRNGLRGPGWKSTSCRGNLMSSTLSTCSVGSGFPAATEVARPLGRLLESVAAIFPRCYFYHHECTSKQH